MSDTIPYITQFAAGTSSPAEEAGSDKYRRPKYETWRGEQEQGGCSSKTNEESLDEYPLLWWSLANTVVFQP